MHTTTLSLLPIAYYTIQYTFLIVVPKKHTVDNRYLSTFDTSFLQGTVQKALLGQCTHKEVANGILADRILRN